MSKPVLILIPGFGFHHKIWEPILPFLNEFELLLIDLPGFGTSNDLVDYSMKSLVNFILSKAPSKAHYCGWSLGCLPLFSIALNYPERVLSLTSLASSPRLLETSEWPGISKTEFRAFSQHLKINPQKCLENFWQIHIKYQSLNRLKESWRSYPLPSLSTLLFYLEIMQKSDYRHLIPQIQCPQFFIFGKRDLLVPFQTADKLKALHPRSRIQILTNTNHAPFLRDPQLFTTCIKNFALTI